MYFVANYQNFLFWVPFIQGKEEKSLHQIYT